MVKCIIIMQISLLIYIYIYTYDLGAQCVFMLFFFRSLCTKDGIRQAGVDYVHSYYALHTIATLICIQLQPPSHVTCVGRDCS